MSTLSAIIQSRIFHLVLLYLQRKHSQLFLYLLTCMNSPKTFVITHKTKILIFLKTVCKSF